MERTEQLTEKQLENWRSLLLAAFGPKVETLVTDEGIQKLRDEIKRVYEMSRRDP